MGKSSNMLVKKKATGTILDIGGSDLFSSDDKGGFKS